MRLFFRSQFRQIRGIVSLEKPQTYPDLMPCTIYETGSSSLPPRLGELRTTKNHAVLETHSFPPE